MKSNMRFLRVFSAMVIIAFLALPVALNGQAGKANFAGTWALNASKSDMGTPPGGGQAGGQGGGQRMGGFGGGNMTVKQEANLLTIERTRQGQDGQSVTTAEKVSLDGKETVNTNARGGESKMTATWSADGKSLTVVTTRDFNGNQFKTTAVWTLADASTLSVTTTMATQNGDRTTKAVYDKK